MAPQHATVTCLLTGSITGLRCSEEDVLPHHACSRFLQHSAIAALRVPSRLVCLWMHIRRRLHVRRLPQLPSMAHSCACAPCALRRLSRPDISPVTGQPGVIVGTYLRLRSSATCMRVSLPLASVRGGPGLRGHKALHNFLSVARVSHGVASCSSSCKHPDAEAFSWCAGPGTDGQAAAQYPWLQCSAAQLHGDQPACERRQWGVSPAM